jgi:hypothetical protein
MRSDTEGLYAADGFGFPALPFRAIPGAVAASVKTAGNALFSGN